MQNKALNLIVGNAVSENFIVSDIVLVYPTAITGVSLNGINDTVFDFLDNTGVVGLSIRFTPFDYILPDENCSDKGAF